MGNVGVGRPLVAGDWFNECTLAGQVGLSDVSSITAGLVNTPIWGFWWD